jgi:Mce-associated membrane protein
MATVAGRRRIAGDGSRERRVELVDLTAAPLGRADQADAIDEGNDGNDVNGVHEVTKTGQPGLAEILTDESGPEPAEPEELDDADPKAKPSAVRRWRPTALTAALVVCLAALLIASALSLTMSRRDRADVSAGNAALAAAKTSAATVLSYDYRQLDSDFAAATALTTGSLRSDYQATTSKAVAQLATQTHAVVTAKVVAGGVVSSSATRVTVLLFVDQTTTSNRLNGPKVDQNRVQLVMQKVGSHWLVSGLKAL